MSDADLIRCPGCGVDNRVPRGKIERGLTAVCGPCKTPLPRASGLMTVTDASFPAEVERSPLPGGQEIDRIVGAHPKAEIRRRLEQATNR